MTDQYITRTASWVENNRIRSFIILILFLTASCPLFARNLPNYQELMQQLGMPQKDIASLHQGEIVFFNVSEGNEKELSVGAVVYLHAQPSKITNFIVTQGLASLDSDVTVEQSIPLQATLLAVMKAMAVWKNLKILLNPLNLFSKAKLYLEGNML